ncbi:MAG: ChaN family lipoprotein [Gemmatimonadales bacterium]
MSAMVLAVPAAAIGGQTARATEATQPGYVAHRVYDTHHERFIDFESMLADVTGADVLFLGEQHDDPATHRLEAAALEGLARRRSNIVLAMEMFERDVQPALDDYLGGRITEAAFLASSRPWPRYATDYRPLVEFARAYKWPVIASDVPRRLASLVSARGLKTTLDSLSTTDRAYAARDLWCPHDDYFRRFAKTMGHMPSHGGGTAGESAADKAATFERIYLAQCIKDETMSESVATAFTVAPPRALVVHVNGAFHSDYGLGTAERVKRRLPGKRVVVVSFVPTGDLDSANGKSQRTLADFIVFTLAPAARANAGPAK